ncbi:MAG TPA: undecaprenyl-diphosphate phosphatase [Thermodesulfobacteriota bacterium]|nr:undecaprenyl-diphosphate phosphatase [Thermodesulfobacteriota bacterium]
MTIPQAVAYGVVQGLGEFLPISSSAHLFLLPWFLGWPDPGLPFTVALHAGTLVALLAHFWREFARLLRALAAAVAERKVGADPDRRLAVALAVASVPGGVAGYLLNDHAETLFRTPGLVAVALVATGVLLYLVDRLVPGDRPLERLTLTDALAIGAAQALAIVPGVSRSGATIAAARALGATREAAARFSFLLSAPIVLGATLLEAPQLAADGGLSFPLAVAVASSALVGYGAIRYLLAYVRAHDYSLFVYYRVALGLAVLGVLAARGAG